MFGVTTLPVTLTSLKCNQAIYLPCYSLSLSHGAVWSISMCLQMGADPTCVDFCLVVSWETLWPCRNFYFVMGTWSFRFNAGNESLNSNYMSLATERGKDRSSPSLHLKHIPACVAPKLLVLVGGWSSLQREKKRPQRNSASCLKKFIRKGTLFPLHLVLELSGEKESSFH